MAKKPKALQSDTTGEFKAWINQPKNAGMVFGGLVLLLIVAAVISSAKSASREAAAIAKAVQMATQEIDPKIAQFEATNHRLPWNNEEIQLIENPRGAWAPLTTVSVRTDGSVLFGYRNPKGGHLSSPLLLWRLRDTADAKAGTCSVAGVSPEALSKNGLNCDGKTIGPAPEPQQAQVEVAAAPPVEGDGTVPAEPVEGEAEVAPTQHLSIERDEVDADLVIEAIDRDDAEALKQLKAEGTHLCDANPEGRLPIVEAARSGQMKTLALLIAEPCPLQQPEPFSQSTALISAVSLRNARAANALLVAGAQPDFAPPGKPTAWQLLGDGEEAEIMQLREVLRSRGANINQTTADGSNLLIRATTRGSLEMVRWLISRNADLNVQDRKGRSAVIVAVTTPTPESIRILQALIGAKADLNLRDAENYTALGRIMTMTQDPTRQAEVRTMLQRAGAKG